MLNGNLCELCDLPVEPLYSRPCANHCEDCLAFQCRCIRKTGLGGSEIIESKSQQVIIWPQAEVMARWGTVDPRELEALERPHVREALIISWLRLSDGRLLRVSTW